METSCGVRAGALNRVTMAAGMMLMGLISGKNNNGAARLMNLAWAIRDNSELDKLSASTYTKSLDTL